MKAGGRAPLWGILAVAVGAPVLSTLLFLFWTPADHTNNGEVLPPARAPAALPAANGGAPFVFANAGGQWTLLAAAPAACDAACRRRLCRMRQLRLLLPGHYLRLRRVWLLTDGGAPPARLPQPADCGEAKNPALQSRAGVADVLDGVFVVRGGAELLPPARAGNAAAAVYLIDPNGVWAMRFAPHLSPAQIRADMARLLKISRGTKKLKAANGV